VNGLRDLHVLSVLGIVGGMTAIISETSLITTGEAARLLGVSRSTMVRMLDKGILPSYRPNSHRMVDRGMLLAWRDERSRALHQAQEEWERLAEEEPEAMTVDEAVKLAQSEIAAASAR
jgi:excisionase family DNA binding protein